MTTTAPDPVKKRAKNAAKSAASFTRSDAEQLACKAAALSLSMQSRKLQFSEQVKALKEQVESDLEADSKEYKALVKQLNTWATVHRKEEFGDDKTFTLAGHELRFRVSPGKVEYSDGMNEEAVVLALANLPDDDELAEKFLRHFSELNKEAIAEEWDKYHTELQKYGVRFSKPELFSFSPNLDLLKESAAAPLVQPETTIPTAA